MTCERPRASRRRQPRAWSLAVLAVALVAAGCSDDGGNSASAPPVATVHGIKIFESDVDALASDAGFLEFIGATAPEADDTTTTSVPLAQTEAGRRTLTWLIGKALIDSELKVQGLDVDRDARKKAEDDLAAGDVPADVNAIADGDTKMGRDAADTVAGALAAYVTLDKWLRSIDPADKALHDRVLAEHPEVADGICGSALSVDEKDAKAVRDQLKAAITLDQIADSVPTLSRTPAGGECFTRGLYPRELVDLLYGTPVGSAGETTVVSHSTGKPVVFFVAPSVEAALTGDGLDGAITDTLQRLHDDGGAAFAELAYSTIDPKLDGAWGAWDPTSGVTAADAEPTFVAFDLPEPTTTTIATTTTAPPPPPPAESSEFVDGSQATLAGTAPGDPGTGDLVARSQAALNSVIPSSWRQALPVRLSIINGATSLSWTDGRIEVGSVHATGDWTHLRAVMGHEFGHQVGFTYGSQTSPGTAPTGWPPSGYSPPEEAWADCVSSVYIVEFPCGGSSQAWTTDWMGAGPGGHPRTA